MGTLPAGVLAWLVKLEGGPQRRPRSRSGQWARDHGLTEPEVQYEGRLMGVSRAKAASPVWWQTTQYTGRDVLTEAGLQALANLR